jgi:hypothetical protein
MRAKGFLPYGLFERLIGNLILVDKNSSNAAFMEVYSNFFRYRYGRQEVSLTPLMDLNAIQLDIEGCCPFNVFELVTEMIRKIKSESFSTLNVTPFIRLPKSMSRAVYFELNSLTDAFAKKDSLVLSCAGERITISFEDMRHYFADWVRERYLDAYDAFISYRWNNSDSALATQLFHVLSNEVVGPNHRGMEVFQDKERLRKGTDFRLEFVKALVNSTVVVPLVSTDALERMISHDVTCVDNLLIEWILSMLLFDLGSKHASPWANSIRLKRIYPVMIGPRDSITQLTNMTLFSCGIMEKLPRERPTATMNLAFELLSQTLKIAKETLLAEAQRVSEFTVLEIVQEITTKNGHVVDAGKTFASIVDDVKVDIFDICNVEDMKGVKDTHDGNDIDIENKYKKAFQLLKTRNPEVLERIGIVEPEDLMDMDIEDDKDLRQQFEDKLSKTTFRKVLQILYSRKHNSLFRDENLDKAWSILSDIKRVDEEKQVQFKRANQEYGLSEATDINYLSHDELNILITLLKPLPQRQIKKLMIEPL